MVLKRWGWMVDLAGNFLFSSTSLYYSREQRVDYDLGRFKRREILGYNCLEEWKGVGYVPHIPSRKTYHGSQQDDIPTTQRAIPFHSTFGAKCLPFD